MNGHDTAFPTPEDEKNRQKRAVRGAFIGGVLVGIVFTIGLAVLLAHFLNDYR
jgi:hypothetical protein